MIFLSVSVFSMGIGEETVLHVYKWEDDFEEIDPLLCHFTMEPVGIVDLWPNGRVRGVNLGTTVITVIYLGEHASCTVSVTDTNFSLILSSSTVAVGESITYAVYRGPYNITRYCDMSASVPSKVVIFPYPDCIIYGRSEGETLITAVTDVYGGGTVSVLLTVEVPEGYPVGAYNEGNTFALAPGDDQDIYVGTAVWFSEEFNFYAIPITPIHSPGCGYWWKVVGRSAGPTNIPATYVNKNNGWLSNKGEGPWVL